MPKNKKEMPKQTPYKRGKNKEKKDDSSYPFEEEEHKVRKVFISFILIFLFQWFSKWVVENLSGPACPG